MRAITVIPGVRDSARLEEVGEPSPQAGSVLVEAVAIGVCGTDGEILRGEYGWAPPGRARLVLGHESLGRVIEAPDEAPVAAGDLVVGIVRRPDPEPCVCCARGEWDQCRNGRYTERGIKEIDGYGSERWRVEPAFAVRVDPRLGRLGVLLEPASIVAKAWDQIDRISRRACTRIERALVTGAGPIGLLAALLARQRGLEVHVLDVVAEGPKPEAVAALGAAYHCGDVSGVGDVDVVVEATGVGSLVFDVIGRTSPGGVVCLTGVSPAGRTIEIDAGAVNREIVLENDVVFGSVNANRRHYELAAEALARADRDWLERIVTRWVGLDEWRSALERRVDDIKVAIAFGAS
ncbi:MAG TPA: glucose 1-dehydrogenase [Solirubrobacteraceae bacterium]|nr:glucose 1-dehydrogenase [Solirubrobacteraceae bacterium]